MKTWFTLGAASLVLLLGLTVSVSAADKAPAPATLEDEKLPAADALKIVAGTAEGHKAPSDVLKKAIKAAKDGKLDDLKSCWVKDSHEYLDQTYYWKDKEQKNIEVIAHHLASFNPEKLKELAQNSCGKYAVIQTETDKGTHMIRAIWHTKNWYLKDSYPDEFSRNYMAGMEDLKKIIEAADGAKLKEKLDSYEIDTFELLVGVQEGVNPYDLLAKRLKMIITDGGKPRIFLSSWSAELALWFNNPKAEKNKDTFLAIRLSPEYDSKSGEYNTVSKVSLNSTAQFHKRPAGQFASWVQDYDYMYTSEEEGGGK